jgi:hypothetical protein
MFKRPNWVALIAATSLVFVLGTQTASGAPSDPIVEFFEDCSIGLHQLVITPQGNETVTVSVSLGVAPAFEVALDPGDPPWVASVPEGGGGSGSVYVWEDGVSLYQIGEWVASTCVPPLPDGWRLDLGPYICLGGVNCEVHRDGFPVAETFYIEHGWFIDDEFELGSLVGPGTGFDLYVDGLFVPAIDLVVQEGTIFRKFSIYQFPGGMSGTHNLYGEWWFEGQLDSTAEVDATFGNSGTFIDDDGSTFESEIEWLAAEGITRGCNPPSNTRFCPDDFVTRGQMAAFLVRALGYTDDGGGNLFVDDDDSIFELDIDRLGTAGVTRGCNPPTNTRFCPDDFVTRGQMAAFLVRALGYTDDGGGDLFVDDDDSSFEGDIDRLGTAGVTRGCNPPANTRFCPDDFVTRGQMAAFLFRVLR